MQDPTDLRRSGFSLICSFNRNSWLIYRALVRWRAATSATHIRILIDTDAHQNSEGVSWLMCPTRALAIDEYVLVENGVKQSKTRIGLA